MKEYSDNALDWEPLAGDDGEIQRVFVANGEIGRVLAIDRKMIVVDMGNQKIVRVPLGAIHDENGEDGHGCNFDLAFAVSCHKMQGSESSATIVVIDDSPGARFVCDRSWLYTAISRAKKLCIMIGKRDVADQFCRRVALNHRKTFLRELLTPATPPIDSE